LRKGEKKSTEGQTKIFRIGRERERKGGVNSKGGLLSVVQ